MHEDGALAMAERESLKGTLERMDVLIRNRNHDDFGTAAKLVRAWIDATPSLQKSPNMRLAELLFIYCDGDHEQARIAESEPGLRVLGGDSLAYRVELMTRLKMDPLPLMNQIISSPETSRVLLVQALVERARYVARFNDLEATHSDLESARRLSQGTPAMLRWVESERSQITR